MRIITLLVILVLSISKLHAQKPLIVSSASIFADMAKNIVGDLADVDMIVPVGADPHLHEPTPRDAKLVGSADIILLNGLTFEGWINELVENSGTKAKSILITEGVDAIRSNKYKNATDPHAWMDASNGIIYTRNIAKAVAELLPDSREIIEENASVYMEKLNALDQYIKTEVGRLPTEQRVLITSHDAFEYYGRRYGLALESTIGISTEADVQTSDIARVTQVIKERSIPAVFIESTINPKLLQQIAKDTGVKIGGELYADSLGKEGSEEGTYIGMLKHNTDVIVAALSQKQVEKTRIDNDRGSSSSWWVYGIVAAVLLVSLLLFIAKMNK